MDNEQIELQEREIEKNELRLEKQLLELRIEREKVSEQLLLEEGE